jgi:flagellar hook protein FlgE
MPLTSFYTALTGLNNNSLAINIVGDNLANMNTVGFKSSKANFGELLAGLQGTSENGNPISFGLGSTINGVSRMNTQGAISFTGNTTDAAINGNGYFIVETDGGMGYTRCGRFEYNRNGGLVTSDGFDILGHMAENGVLNTTGPLVPIEIQKGQLMPPRATTSLSPVATLPGDALIGDSYSTPAQVYDSLGVAHPVNITYTNTGSRAWTWNATVPAADFGGTETDPAVSVGTGALTFDSNGNLSAPTANPSISITGLANGAANLTITLGLLDENSNSLLTNFGSSFTSGSTGQDGTAASTLKSISIDSRGFIIGQSETGTNVVLAQLAMADFPNIEGLQKYKGSTFTAFPSAGEPSIGTAGTGSRGTIVGSSVEQSNVDMAQEFVNLIVAQRAYQANSRIITTTDELYQESISLKR